MEGVDSDDHDQEVIILPIRDKTRAPSPAAIGYRTENRVTVINIEKSNNANVVCEICSSTLKSMKYLERHMKSEILVFTVLYVEFESLLKSNC